MLRTTLQWGGLALLALVTLVFLINPFDQDIRPEVAAFSDFSSEQVPPEQNAFFTLMGHTAAVTDDPHRKGVEIIATYNQRVAAAKHYDPTILETPAAVLGPRQLKFKDDTTKLCASKAQRCLGEYGQKARLIERMWSDNRILVNRYHRLYDYPNYRDTTTDSVCVLFPTGDAPTSTLVRAHIGLQTDSRKRERGAGGTAARHALPSVGIARRQNPDYQNDRHGAD